MDTKRLRSEFEANVALVMTQATSRQTWTKPAPIRRIVKRSFFGMVRALFQRNAK